MLAPANERWAAPRQEATLDDETLETSRKPHDHNETHYPSRGSRSSGGHTRLDVALSGPHPAAGGTRYGERISQSRQDELLGALTAWDEATDHGSRRGPFDGRRLTGADVSWLAERVRDAEGHVPGLHLEGADLHDARLKEAELARVRLQGANLRGANLKDAVLRWAHLEGADLSVAHLEGAYVSDAHLQGADLHRATFDEGTSLNRAELDDKTRLRDIHWAGVGTVNLTQIDWSAIARLGDERALTRGASADELELVARAYWQVAAQLRAQGLAEVADRFLYRAQIVQRRALLRRGRIGQWLFSWLLGALAGYGYRPGRTVAWYLVIVAAFTVGYYLLGPSQGHSFLPDGALVFSVTSFHGRGFFPEALSFESWITRLAALEAVLGLFVEISFIATFTQRFFGGK
jgi:uncharacterized protein YjbI with pentapeptide repeats